VPYKTLKASVRPGMESRIGSSNSIRYLISNLPGSPSVPPSASVHGPGLPHHLPEIDLVEDPFVKKNLEERLMAP